MRGIIYTLNLYDGDRILKEIVGEMALNKIHHCRYEKSLRKIIVEFENGDIWMVFSAASSARGYKWDYCFIDRRFSQEVIDQQILPYASNNCAETTLERRITYF